MTLPTTQALQTEIEQLKKEIEFQKSQLELNSKLATLGEMAAGIGHEINNPLAIISSRAGSILDLCRTDQITPLQVSQVRDSAASIEKTVLRISKIVKTLKSFTRGLISENHEYVSLSELVNEALDLSKARLRKHDIETSFESQAMNDMIFCSPSQITQVLMNLLNNSCDAVESLETKWIRILLEQSATNSAQDGLKITITDSGQCPSESIRNKMMDPFFTTKSPGRGTGLGLSISKKIIDQHRGTLILNQSSSQTQFIIEIPRMAEVATPLFGQNS